MTKIDCRRYMPLGFDCSGELLWIRIGMILSVLYSMIFFIEYSDCYQNLFVYNRGLKTKTLIDGAVMEDFAAMMPKYLMGFAVLAMVMVFVAVYHYMFHFSGGSKSIYTMRRLPSALELHKRCLTVPVLTVLLCAVTAFILMLIYFGFYMWITPEKCLTQMQWEKIWDHSLIQPIW